MIKKVIAAVVALSFGLVARATTVETNGTEVTITADAAYTYAERLDSQTTVLNLAGGQEVTLAAVDNSFAGTVNLMAGKVVFDSGTFSAGATIDGATLNMADGTYAVMKKVLSTTPIPWKLVATSGTVHLSGRGTVGSTGPDKYDRWGGTVSLAKGVTLYIDGENGGIITYGIDGASSASATWIDGAIEGEGTIAINNNTGGKGVLGFGNPNTVKSPGGFSGLYDSFRMVDAGNVIFKGTYQLYRDQRPYNINSRLSIVSNTFVTTTSPKTIGYTGYARASYLDIRDGGVVSNRIDLGTRGGNQGTVFLTSADASKPSRAYFCCADNDVNVIGNVRASVDGRPNANAQYPGSGYVMLRNGIAEFDRPVELGRTSRGYIDIRTGGQVITHGTNSTWCVGGHQMYTPKLTDACHGAIRVGAGGLFKSDGDILLTYGTRNDIAADVGLRDVGYGELTVSGAGATAEVREIALMFGRQNTNAYASQSLPGSVGFVNIRNGGVLTASRIYRDAIDSDVRQTGKTTSIWGTLTESQYAKSCLYLNFAGGTLKIASSGRFFIPLSGQYEGTKDTMRYPKRVTIYSGGATIDTDGHDVIWDVPIVNAEGKIVAGLGDTLLASGYVANHPPRVRVLSKTGDGHASSVSVWANYTDENHITLPMTYEVTSQGFNETTGDLVATVEDFDSVMTNILGTVGLTWATGEWSSIPPESYSFAKKGAGTLTLKGANNWIGPTRIEAGTLEFTDAAGLPAGTVEIVSSALVNGVTPLKVKAYTGGEIHIVGASLDDAWFEKQVRILASDTAMAQAPTVKVYDASGAELDISGWTLSLSADGKALKLGKEPTKEVTIADSDTARGTIEPTGDFSVTNGEIVTVTATPNNHALVGWNVDGEFVEASGLTYDYRADLTKDTLSLTPVFSTNLYVNAKADDDSGDGMTPETAKQTLAAIAALAIPGDTIHAAPGTYDKGYSDVVTGYTPYIIDCKSGDSFSNTRVFLAEGVSLVADEGPAVTTIVGYAAPKGQGEAKYEDTGCGPSSLRCVVARANTYLKGFTIKDGYTRGLTGSITDANAGGCILAPDYDVGQRAGTLLVEDCRISNGHARSGCCVSGGIYVRCVVKNGVSFSSSGPRIGYAARFIDCVLYQSSESMLQDPRGVYNTFVYSTSTLGQPDFSGTTADYPVVNSVVYTAGVKSGSTAQLKYFKNCYVQFMSSRVSLDETTCENCVTTNGLNYSVNFSLLGFNTTGTTQPTGLLATSPLIDAGDSTLVPPECLAGDVDGLQRIWNAKLDIGPFEYVPTNEFSAAICGRHAEVSGASEMTELKDAAIDIPDGETLSITWKGGAAGETAKLTVSALAGNLKVYRGDEDEPIQTIDEAGTYTIESVAATTELKFVAEDGTATITGFVPDRPGLILIFK